MQGFDLMSPLSRGEPSPRQCAVATLYRSCALATRRWKLEYTFEEGQGRLFDRLHDPNEQHDLFAAPEAADVRTALLTALLAWRAELLDVEWLQAHTSGGGPIARIVADHTRGLRGTDAEARLNARVAALE
jgi:arylsulfatase